MQNKCWGYSGLIIILATSIVIPNRSIPHATTTVLVSDDHWSVEIDPSTLAATGRFADGSQIPVSLSGAVSYAPANIVSGPRQVAWDLPLAHLHISARMDKDRFIIEAISSQPGKISWPVLPYQESLAGIMLPLGEGFYIPVRETVWQGFALEHSPISTMETLSMPLWGMDYGNRSLTYVLLNPFDNDLAFELKQPGIGLRLTHAFQGNYSQMRYAMMVVPGSPSPVEPARIFREWLIESGRFVTLSQKLEKLPELEKLFGAAHVYLWASGVLDAEDVRRWPELIRALRQPVGPRARRVVAMLPSATRTSLRDTAAGPSSRYLRTQILDGLNEIVRSRDLYRDTVWPRNLLPDSTRALADKGVPRLTDPDLVKLNSSLLALAFPKMLAASTTFGSGISPKMIERLEQAGLDRLWLGVSDVDVLHFLPETVSAAKRAGYLFGTYDSYHSIHPPDAKETWPTAQFDWDLYRKGAIVRADGSQDRGFKGVGSHLSSIAAEPYIRRRVDAWMKEFGFNSYFVDCDATGELFDNYSLLFPATKELDMKKRLQRLAWIRDTWKLVVGSEVGAWFAASEIHFGHGMMTPVFGFRDPLLHDPKSPYFMGRAYPAGGPTTFFNQTVLPQKYKETYFDPRYRLPLYQAAFHDSIVTTHHWDYPSWKFTNVQGINELLELLYGVPPLYHLNIQKLSRQRAEIQRHSSFFSPNYRRLATLPLSRFSWLTPDHLVQMTRFGDDAVVVANFGTHEYVHEGHTVPPSSILLVWTKTGQVVTYRAEHPAEIEAPKSEQSEPSLRR